jgi:hypothetical protein
MTHEEKLVQLHLENAHARLTQAAKFAHIDKLPCAEKISKLIDSLETILEKENLYLIEESSK